MIPAIYSYYVKTVTLEKEEIKLPQAVDILNGGNHRITSVASCVTRRSFLALEQLN